MIHRILAGFHRYVVRRHRTVRHTFSLATIAMVSLVATVLLSTDTASLRLESSAGRVSEGERFTVTVYAQTSEPVNAVDVSIAFPEDTVTVTSIRQNRSVISIWTQDPYVDGNEIILQGGTFRKGFIGEHILADIEFEALENGEAEFSVDENLILAGDGSGSEIEDVAVGPPISVSVSQTGVLTADTNLIFNTDVDGDGAVTLSDINSFMEAWRLKSNIYDFNADNKMNFTDFAIILADSWLR